MIFWQAAIVGWIVMILIMALLWFIQRKTHNAGIVDIAWSFGTGFMGVWFAWTADGDEARRMIVASLAGLWGLRLGIYLFKRVMSEAEDGRYKMLREKWGEKTQSRLFFLFQVQAAWAVLFAIPMWAAADNATTGVQWTDITGIGIWLIAVIGETIADKQLAQFRINETNKGKVCQVGLWRYSRHPNYFFEWLGWWAYVLLAAGSSFVWIALLGPIVMYLFITKVTGIPPTEARAIQSRGEAYRQYQQTTNALFPGPPSQPKEAAS